MRKCILEKTITLDEPVFALEEMVCSKSNSIAEESFLLPSTLPHVQAPTIRVFTDGSTKNNGKANAVGGIGVYFPEGQLPAISLRYNGNRLRVCPRTGNLLEEGQGTGIATNQRAELEAIYVAIELISQLPDYIPKKTHIHIFTDSEYSQSCLTNWAYTWMQNDWKTSNKHSVKNRDLIEPLFLECARHRVIFFHAPAHTEKQDDRSRGNAIADSLAKGAMKPKEAAQIKF